MSTPVEVQIKELERKLDLKRAYMGVQFSFAKGSKIPSDIQEEIISKLQELCKKLAEETEISQVSNNSSLTEEELSILKSLVSTVKAKTTALAGRPSPLPPSSEGHANYQKDSNPTVKFFNKKATILTLDNVTAKVREAMEPQSVVEVSRVKGDTATIVTKDGRITQIPVNDLEFIE